MQRVPLDFENTDCDGAAIVYSGDTSLLVDLFSSPLLSVTGLVDLCKKAGRPRKDDPQ